MSLHQPTPPVDSDFMPPTIMADNHTPHTVSELTTSIVENVVKPIEIHIVLLIDFFPAFLLSQQHS